jgi:hypothetical protein
MSTEKFILIILAIIMGYLILDLLIDIKKFK